MAKRQQTWQRAARKRKAIRHMKADARMQKQSEKADAAADQPAVEPTDATQEPSESAAAEPSEATEE
jgi:hypothetical protein